MSARRGMERRSVGGAAVGAVLRWAVLAAAVLAAGCGAGTRGAARTAVVAAGAALAQVHDAHQQAYTSATDSLREDVRAHGGDLAEYERRVAPLDAEFRRRSAAIATLDSQLYAAAAVLDASRRDAGSADYAQAACAVLDAIQRAVDALEQGAVLAPVAIPPEVQRVVTALGEISGGCHGGQ